MRNNPKPSAGIPDGVEQPHRRSEVASAHTGSDFRPIVLAHGDLVDRDAHEVATVCLVWNTRTID
jgi:hypothetical protein